MYRCELCREVSEPNQRKRKHYLYRPNKEIERELAVCVTCQRLLDGGQSLASVVADIQASQQVEISKSLLPEPKAPEMPVHRPHKPQGRKLGQKAVDAS